MTIDFYIDDDVVLSSERCDITLKGDLFDKPKEDNKYLLAMLKNIAKLRGHSPKSEIRVIHIYD